MGEYEGDQPATPAEEPEVPVEEGEKYDGGDIPRSEPTEQED
jgi:hypothetical protein